MVMKKVAFFDIDGTLFRWQLYHELVFELKEQGVFDTSESSALDEALLSWQAKHVSWRDYEMLVVETIEKHIADISPSQLEQTAATVVERSGHKIYNYTAKLLHKLRDEGYHTVAISASQQEIAEQFAEKYEFDECIGALYERQNDRYTGTITRYIHGRKHEVIAEFMASRPELTLDDSYAVGDSGGDITMLEMVTNPVAFNPSQELFEQATKHNWPIVVERKNIAYVLKEQDGRVVLDHTDIY